MLEWLVQEFQSSRKLQMLPVNWACFFAFRQAFDMGIDPGNAILGWSRFGRWDVTDANLNLWLSKVIYREP